jgi:hypothetical protein
VTTILEFPQDNGSVPRIPDSETKRQASDFCDLEGPLCDVVTMASIAAQIATNARTDDGDLVFAFVTSPKCSTRSRSSIMPLTTVNPRSSRSTTKRQAARSNPPGGTRTEKGRGALLLKFLKWNQCCLLDRIQLVERLSVRRSGHENDPQIPS